MKQFSSSDLKTILHSKRANIYYLEHCRLLVNGGRVEYLTNEGNESHYWNIPIANTTTLLLGSGTSVTQAAMRELAKAGVIVGFCGGGGTPLYCGTERDFDILWSLPQSEYRPTQYLQQWFKMWIDEDKRLVAAKKLQDMRIDFIETAWVEKVQHFDEIFRVESSEIKDILKNYRREISQAKGSTELFTVEARFTKRLYEIVCRTLAYREFSRVKQGKGVDPANRNLDYGNYLAYGLGATATWVLGLPHSLSVLHGKTRRGGLVFDAADLIKDALVLPQAFISAVLGHADNEFKGRCIQNFIVREALDYMIDSLKSLVQEGVE